MNRNDFFKFRFQIARNILIGIGVLGVVLGIAYVTPGYEDFEINEILKIVIPVKSLYLSTIIAFIINTNKADQRGNHSIDSTDNINTENNTTGGKEISDLYKTMTKVIIMIHLFGLILVVILGMVNIIENKVVVNSIVFLESFFGVYIGTIFNDLFNTNKK